VVVVVVGFGVRVVLCDGHLRYLFFGGLVEPHHVVVLAGRQKLAELLELATKIIFIKNIVNIKTCQIS
jgi:hypothetical protein